MGSRPTIALAVLAATFAVSGCLGGGIPIIGPDQGPNRVTSTKDGLTLAVELDRSQVEPGGSVVANVALRNGRPQPVEYSSTGCQPVRWNVKLRVPAEPEGRAWPGIAGEFKTYALTKGFGPGGVPVLQPVDTSPRFAPCQMEPGRTTLAAGETGNWTLTWPAEIVDGVPALPGEAPFTIAMSYDPDKQAAALQARIGVLPLRFQSWKQISVDGRLLIVGEAPRPQSAGEAIDVLLSDPKFAAWLAERPSATWSTANVFLQSWPKNEGIVPAGPAWELDLFRENGVPRNWAIAFVQPYTGKLSLNFCNVPCDR